MGTGGQRRECEQRVILPTLVRQAGAAERRGPVVQGHQSRGRAAIDWIHVYGKRYVETHDCWIGARRNGCRRGSWIHDLAERRGRAARKIRITTINGGDGMCAE